MKSLLFCFFVCLFVFRSLIMIGWVYHTDIKMRGGCLKLLIICVLMKSSELQRSGDRTCTFPTPWKAILLVNSSFTLSRLGWDEEGMSNAVKNTVKLFCYTAQPIPLCWRETGVAGKIWSAIEKMLPRKENKTKPKASKQVNSYPCHITGFG